MDRAESLEMAYFRDLWPTGTLEDVKRFRRADLSWSGCVERERLSVSPPYTWRTRSLRAPPSAGRVAGIPRGSRGSGPSVLPGTRDAQVAWGDGSRSGVMTPCFHSRPVPCAVGTARRPAPGPRMGTLGLIRPGLNRSRGRVLPLMPAVPGRVEMVVSLPASATASR